MWLITGGAGYIGGHVVQDMLASGRDVVILDDLSSGRLERVPEGVTLIAGRVGDRELLRRVFAEHPITGVMHFAAQKQVGESVARPLYYWDENIVSLHVLLEEMVHAGVKQMVFSSSAAVYGEPAVDGAAGERVTEGTPCLPISPYGATKLAGEWMVSATAQAHGWKTLNLRYFNVAGAGSPELGDLAAANLIPMVFQALEDARVPQVFGDDYPTSDGSAIRDYIHVSDLSMAHVAAAGVVEAGAAGERLVAPSTAVNIGTGTGYSVFEVLDSLRASMGSDFPMRVVERRPGDAPAIVAAPDLAHSLLGWTAQHSLSDMTDSAWAAWQANAQARSAAATA